MESDYLGFLQQAKTELITGLKNNEVTMDSLPYLMCAYGKVDSKIDGVQEMLETYALKNFDQLTGT